MVGKGRYMLFATSIRSHMRLEKGAEREVTFAADQSAQPFLKYYMDLPFSSRGPVLLLETSSEQQAASDDWRATTGDRLR